MLLFWPGNILPDLTPWVAESDDNTSVFAGQPIGKRLVTTNGFSKPVVDIVVLEVLWGTELSAGDTITLIGQDGVNCGISLDLVNDIQAQIFGVWAGFNPAGDPGYIHRYYELLFCGVTVLQIEDGLVYGPIAPGIDSLSYADFISNEAYCIEGQLPEGCSCTAQVVEFCDEVAAIDQRDIDFGIVRLTQLFDNLPAYDSSGFSVSLNSAIITEVLLGDEFVGDTVAVVKRDNLGCVEWNLSADALWAYTEVDYDGATYTSRFNSYPRLLAEGCSKNTEEIRNDSVITLQGLVPYADYLEQLMECVPTLSGDNLSNTINLLVYPNPATDMLFVNWESTQVVRLQLMDAEGRVVLRQEVIPGQISFSLSINQLPKGIYFLRLLVDGKVATRKVLVR